MIETGQPWIFKIYIKRFILYSLIDLLKQSTFSTAPYSGYDECMFCKWSKIRNVTFKSGVKLVKSLFLRINYLF